MNRAVIVILLVLWVLAMALSGWSLLQPATGDGFTRGLNRVMGFFGWQVAAALLSIAAWFGVRSRPKGTLLRWLGRVPGWWSVVALLGLVGLILYTTFAVQQGNAPPASSAPPGSPTQVD